MSGQPVPAEAPLTGREIITSWITSDYFFDVYDDDHHFAESAFSLQEIDKEDIHYGLRLAGQMLVDRLRSHLQTVNSLERSSRFEADY